MVYFDKENTYFVIISVTWGYYTIYTITCLNLSHLLQSVSYSSSSSICTFWPVSDQDLFSIFLATISKLLHKTLLETKQFLSPLCSLPPLHSRIPPLLQRLFLPEQRHRVATALSHSRSLSTTSGQVLECHLKICLTSPGEGNPCISLTANLINAQIWYLF